MVLHQLHDDRRDRLGELVLESRRCRRIDLADAGYLRRGLSHRIAAGDQRTDLAQLRGRRHRRKRRVLDGLAVVLDQNKNAHFAIPRPLSRSTSSSTEPTLIPAWRLAGSITLSVSSRRATSTP